MSTQILVVEDETVIARDLRATLVELGYTVPPPVPSGERALEAVASQRPDLVLMDIRIQGDLDGIDTAALIRDNANTPVVFLTAHADETTVARAKASGAYGYIVKPYTDRDLRSAIEVALQKHEVEQRLVKRGRWFATTLASIGDAVVATSMEQKVTFMNAVAERVTGWKASSAIGRRFTDVLPLVDEKTGASMEAPLARALREGSSVDLQRGIALSLPGGERRAIEDSAAPIFDDGKMVGGVMVFRDVTERRQLEERLAQAERLASLGTLSAGMAHEINNPLTYVLANVSFASEVVEDVQKQLRALGGAETDAAAARLHVLVDALRDAREGSLRVQRIVHDLKRFGRLDVADVEPIDLRVVLESAVRMTEKVLRQHAGLSHDYQPTPVVDANEGQLIQVFVNLLMNAAQAQPEEHVEQNKIVVATYTDAAGRAVAEVRDSGPGIPEELQRRIFDPFFTTKPVGQGSGLGLSIAHSIVESLGGEITVASEERAGTVFRVALPAAKSSSSERPPDGRPKPLRRGSILVIDDELALSRAISRVLQEDHDVFVETDPREAVRRLVAGEFFDVVLCDLMMPGMTGSDVIDAVRKERPDVARRFVFMTGGAFTPRSQEFLRSTTSPVLEKPITPGVLRRVIGEQLNRDIN